VKKVVVAGALGECVHVAGILNFLRLAEIAGWKTIFLGPAVPIEKIIEAAKKEGASLVGVSYRLTPETGERLLGDFAEAADELRSEGVRFAFGGTPPVAEKARKLDFFERVFDGSDTTDHVLAFLKGHQSDGPTIRNYPQTVIERIRWKSPFPLLRHHFGLPTLEDTVAGIEKIAASQCLDVISLGIDQDAQENFFHPEKQDPRRKGAGGVPVRTAQDYEWLYSASRQGNYPLMRTYSGTNDFIRLARMYVKTIRNAWCAIPLFWFNQMDGRGPWDLEGSIREHQAVMKWYGNMGIPVELNEPHHWGMRDAPDVVYVVSAFLAAYNAKAFGVKKYIAQYMFNSPPGTSDAMDLAKMLAIQKLLKTITDGSFHVYTQTRTGLLSYPLDLPAARSHLASSIYVQMALKPHIVHVVGHSEADHAATAEDVIEACGMARRAIENALNGNVDLTADRKIQKRVTELVSEAKITLKAISALAEPETADALTDATVLTRAVGLGILDAPQLKNNAFAPGKIKTRLINGACVAVDDQANPLSEEDRIGWLMEDGGK
jgi:methylmalonyl-CoA mutase cobalamin-binding subunit